MGLYWTKKLLHSEGNSQQPKKQPTKWDKIFANNISNKGLTSKIHKNTHNLIAAKSNNPIKECAGGLNRHFSREEMQTANRHMKRCSISLIFKEMQIKTTMRHHLTSFRITITKKATNNKCWWGCGEKGALVHGWCDCRWVQPLWKTVIKVPQKIKNRTFVWPSNFTTEYLPKENKNSNQKRYMYSNVRCSNIYESQDTDVNLVFIDRGMDKETVI